MIPLYMFYDEGHNLPYKFKYTEPADTEIRDGERICVFKISENDRHTINDHHLRFNEKKEWFPRSARFIIEELKDGNWSKLESKEPFTFGYAKDVLKHLEMCYPKSEYRISRVRISEV